MSAAPQPLHGGPDGGPPVRHDFSSNASPWPAPAALAALRRADRRRYPDPGYQALREHLGAALGRAPQQLLVASGGAEAIRRLTLLARLRGVPEVWVPTPGFGDYAAAAQALALPLRRYAAVDEVAEGAAAGAWVWICDPCNPTGRGLSAADWATLDALQRQRGLQLALDLAYAPLRLDGEPACPPALRGRLWHLHCPNKALGLTGVRAALIEAPQEIAAAREWRDQALALAPSWVLSAEGVALLSAWVEADVTEYLAQLRTRLRALRQRQHRGLLRRGWRVEPSDCGFALWQPPQTALAPLLQALRGVGIKLRDAESLGAPGRVRISVQPVAAQRALWAALDAFKEQAR